MLTLDTFNLANWENATEEKRNTFLATVPTYELLLLIKASVFELMPMMKTVYAQLGESNHPQYRQAKGIAQQMLNAYNTREGTDYTLDTVPEWTEADATYMKGIDNEISSTAS